MLLLSVLEMSGQIQNLQLGFSQPPTPKGERLVGKFSIPLSVNHFDFQNDFFSEKNHQITTNRPPLGVGGVAENLPNQPKFLSLEPADSLHKTRFWTCLSFGTAVYSGTMYGLYNAWYKDYPLGDFHIFNDNREWNQMDKMGHWLMSYNEARWVAMGANWTGLRPKTAALVGFAGAQLIQTSFEIFDGFSEQWGFSPGDVACNTLGSGMFLAQELAWHEQRIFMKMSAMPIKYSNSPIFSTTDPTVSTTLKRRADELYGTAPLDLFLKNYNTLAVWASFNVRSLAGKDKMTWWPRWLNVAVGMGSNNLFGGFDNGWDSEKDCQNCPRFELDPQKHPRTRQFFLSLDLDPTRLKVKNRFLRTFLQTASIIKFPAPTLEWTDRGKIFFHPVYF